MRLLLFAISLSALGAGSYVGLTSGWAPGSPEAGEVTVVEETQGVTVIAPTSAAPSPRPSTTGVRTTVTAETYTVSGGTTDEILESMAAQGPRTDGSVFFGLTTAEIGLRFRPVPVDGGCILSDVEIDLALTVTLPDWTPPAQADRALTRDWGRFRRALSGHENRHVEIAESGAERMIRALDGMRRASCEIVEHEAQRRIERLEIEIEASQRRYDSETGHGRTEGAVWP